MPKNKNANLRYQVLDKCFSNRGRYYSLPDLVDECETALREENGEDATISDRQIRKDIRYMRNVYSAEITAKILTSGNKRRYVYRYEDPTFSIFNIPMSDDEKGQISAALQLLQRFKGGPQLELVRSLRASFRKAIGERYIPEDQQIVYYDDNPDLQGRDAHFERLFNGIVHRQVLRIHNHSFSEQETKVYRFHPHCLKEFNNRWYVFGYNETKDKQDWNFALDRIKKIEDDFGQYQRCEIDYEEYFADIIGVTRFWERKEMKIVLEFTEKRAPYVRSKPLHQTQKKVGDSGRIFSIQVYPNRELETRIMSFGDQVEVLEPKELRDLIRERLSTAAAQYEEK